MTRRVQSAETLTAQLYAANNVGAAWYIMDSVGLVAAAGLYACGRWTWQLKDWYDKSVGLLVIGVGALHLAGVLAAPDRHGDRGEY